MRREPRYFEISVLLVDFLSRYQLLDPRVPDLQTMLCRRVEGEMRIILNRNLTIQEKSYIHERIEGVIIGADDGSESE